MQSPDEWARNYRVNTEPEPSFDEPFDPNDHTADGTTLSPKGTIGKQTRRRSRASSKAPTTLLNAKASDFRAVVQKYTGYRSAHPAFGNRKGPINLDFSKYNSSHISPSDRPDEARQQLQERREADRKVFSFGGGGDDSIATSGIDHDREVFVPSVNYDRRPEYPLSFDDLDTDSFLMAGPGDHSW